MTDASMATAASAAVVPPGEGKVICAFGDRITVHLGGEQTGGQLTMFTVQTPPHYHAQEVEWFFPLEGRVEFFRDGAWTEVPMGTAVFVPKGVVHAFRNPGDKPLKMLVHTSPAGFEVFFAQCAEEFARPGGPDVQRVLAIAQEHGIHILTP